MPSQIVWKFNPVSYRILALWGHCPALTLLLLFITLSRASGTADHVRSLDDLFPSIPCYSVLPRHIAYYIDCRHYSFDEPRPFTMSLRITHSRCNFPYYSNSSSFFSFLSHSVIVPSSICLLLFFSPPSFSSSS